MPNWTCEQLREYEVRREARRLPPGPEPQQAVRDVAVGPPPREESHPGRYVVRVVSFRRRLLDPDNLCVKYFVDGLRYAKIIPNDRLEDIELQTAQVQVKDKALERTEITVSCV